MITADQLFCHGVGDYVLQSDWMATEKTKKSVAAAAHALTYSLPFLVLTQSPAALAVICLTHFVIDRWRLARFVVWAKNWLAPWKPAVYCPAHECIIVNGLHGPSVSECCVHRCSGKCGAHPRQAPTPSFEECKATGYPPGRPDWLVVWLLIICDNLMHVGINALALRYL